MPSRFRSVPFDDFDVDQLGGIWRKLCTDSGWESTAKVSRVASYRLARGKGRKGFGNGRSVRVLYESAVREAKLRYRGGVPQLLVEDVIGKPPTREQVPEIDAVMRDLEAMVGLGGVKEEFEALLELAGANYRKELAGEKTDDVPLNRLFTGNPVSGRLCFSRVGRESHQSVDVGHWKNDCCVALRPFA